jgi:hypothetical protein
VEPPEKLVREVLVQIGPREDYLDFFDGENLDQPLRGSSSADAETGYAPPGRLRVTPERVEDRATRGATGCVPSGRRSEPAGGRWRGLLVNIWWARASRVTRGKRVKSPPSL